MGRHETARRLIVNADDFGASLGVNAAVIQAHREGILTTASLMVSEPGFADAVLLARQNPRLGVGLHLTLSHGHSVLTPEKIPGLVNSKSEFSNSPVGAGFRYYFHRNLRAQLRREINAQFEKFHSTGLPLDHLNGHLHFHLHPIIFGIVMESAEGFGIQRMRWTREPFWLNARLAGGHWIYRAAHSFIFRGLSGRAWQTLQRKKIRHASRVFGLLQNARVNEEYILRLLKHLPPGDSELYSHPSLDEFKHELDALISPRVKTAVKEQGIELIRYQDL